MDKDSQAIINEIAKWKNCALEAAHVACYNCEEYREDRKHCKECRIARIKEEAGEG